MAQEIADEMADFIQFGLKEVIKESVIYTGGLTSHQRRELIKELNKIDVWSEVFEIVEKVTWIGPE